MRAGDLDTADGVANVQEAASLAAFSVHGKRMPHGGLRTEAVQHRAENFVVVEPVDQRFVESRFVRDRAVYNSLVPVGGAQLPGATTKHDVVAVVYLREMVERAGLLRVREYVLAAVVLDLDISLFDVNIRRSIFAHRAELDEMAIMMELAEREEQVERA